MTVDVEVHVIYRYQTDGHVIVLLYFFFKIKWLHKHSMLLYPCSVGCWAMIKSTVPFFRQDTLRRKRSYPIKRKSFRRCFSIYSPMMYTFELNVMPHVTLGCDAKNDRAAVRFRQAVWRKNSARVFSNQGDALSCMNGILLLDKTAG